MRGYSSPRGRTFTVVSLVLTVVCSLIAFTTNWNQLIFVAVAFALLPIFVGYGMSADRPSDDEIRRFVDRALRDKLGGDAFAIRSLKSGLFSLLYGRRGYIPFRATAALRESLFEPTTAPWQKLEGLTPRRLESVRRQIDSLIDALGEDAEDLKAEMPPDPFATTYVAEKTPKGARLSPSGAVTVLPGDSGWRLSLEFLTWGRRTVEELGFSLGSFGNPVVLGTYGGEKWLVATVKAWRGFMKSVAALQERVQAADVDSGERQVRAFFRTVKAGAIFHGTGRSGSGQHAPLHFVLEVRSVDSDAGNLVFTLRNDGSWENARRFSASVAYDVSERVVWVHARTGKADACEKGGPLIGAETAFTLDFHFKPGSPAVLDSFGGDIGLQLEEVSRAKLRELRAGFLPRKRDVLEGLRAGAVYEGRFPASGADGVFTLQFIEAATGARKVDARLECAGWSGLFHVAENTNASAGEDFDLMLEAASPSAAEELTRDGAGSRWRRLQLSAVENGFRGVAESAAESCEVSLVRSGPVEPAGGGSPGERRAVETVAAR